MQSKIGMIFKAASKIYETLLLLSQTIRKLHSFVFMQDSFWRKWGQIIFEVAIQHFFLLLSVYYSGMGIMVEGFLGFVLVFFVIYAVTLRR